MSKKLNILLVNETSGPGGAETIVYEIARNLAPDQFNVSVVLFRKGWFVDHLRSNGVETEVIESKRSWDISFMHRLASHCRKKDIDIIHAHLPGANLYCSLVGAMLRIPVITTAHNELIMPGFSERFVGLKNFLIRHLSTRNVLVADFMRNSYMTRGKYHSSNVTTIHNGIRFVPVPGQDELMRLRQDIGITTDDIIIGNVANFRTPKGHQYLIEAAGIICRELPQVKLLLIGEEGDGTIKSMINNKISALGIKPQVKSLGFRTDIPQLLYLMDIFVLASISEGLPLSVVEAMAAAKPVVVTDVGGLSEVVTNNENGYLVPPADPKKLAERLITLAKDKKLRQTMGEHGRWVVQAEFSMEKMIDKYQKLYLDITS
ncbi:MAG: glycosyltransferase family 4 protein [candidate division Zixibacteria bacterium]|nr:glycosyltransferase family 4 protein [candidate division Zixibacteria bacterium]